MIAISAIEVSNFPGMIFDMAAGADFRINKARVHRSKTLDGSVVITHLGFVDGDRTVAVSARVTEAQAMALWDFYQEATFIYIAMEDGFFSAAIQDLEINNGDIKMTILIKEREA